MSIVNPQVTDAVTQTNVTVLADSPAMAMSQIYMAAAASLGTAMANAASAQQQSNVTAQAATTMGVATLYSIDTATTGVATKSILTS